MNEPSRGRISTYAMVTGSAGPRGSWTAPRPKRGRELLFRRNRIAGLPHPLHDELGDRVHHLAARLGRPKSA